MMLRIGVAFVLGGTAIGQDAVAFERDVLPVLRERCFDCHGAPAAGANGRVEQPKGGLRLDGRAWIERGGDGGAVLEPGAPDDSELWLRTALPVDDPDVMPAKGDPLEKAQIATLRRWIAEGADFGGWEGAAAAGGAEGTAALPVPAFVQRLEALADGLATPPTSAVARAEQAHARVRSVLGADRRLIAISFPAHRQEVGDGDLKVLVPLRAHVTEVDLARTAITDAAADELSRMPRLTKLDLAHTRIGDGAISKLKALEHLRSLNLFDTAVTDAGLDAIAAMPGLDVVHLWQTEVSEAGAARLRATRPGLRVVLAPDLPAPLPDAEPRTRRRR